MLIVRSIGAGVAPYLVDGRHPGRWSAGAGRLLGLEGPVGRSDLRRVLDGRDPDTGRYLADYRPARRRAGWGLIFSAPKSVSLLDVSAAGSDRSVVASHEAAVEGVMGYLESRLNLWRKGQDGRSLKAEGLISAAFDHSSNAASEPHLHTHVLIANSSRSGLDPQVWGAIQPSDWFVDRAALGALYELELRHQLAERGWQIEWRLRPDGLADVAEVPRAAVRAASTQRRSVLSSGRFPARQAAAPQPWEPRVAAAGLGTGHELRRPGPAGEGPALDDPHLERAVGLRLTSRRSDFRRADVIVALAACLPAGAKVSVATGWADRFCSQSVPVRSPTAGARWATNASRRLDDELSRALTERSGGVDVVSPDLVEVVLAGTPLIAESARQGVRALVSGGPSGVHFLGAPAGRTDLIAQAETISVAATAWKEAGLRAVISAADDVTATRWGVLTGLPPFRAGDRADVVVVDRADRRPSADLLRLVRAASGQIVFVEGGTLPRLTNPASHGLVEAGVRLGRHLSGPHVPWGTPPGLDVSYGPLVGREAADSLVLNWRAVHDTSVLVALGIEEIRELNRAAAGANRSGQGPGRFEAGDRVVVTRARPGLPSFGTFGVVTGVAGRSRSSVEFDWVEFDWEDGTRTVASDPRALASVDFGYAVSPRLAARLDRPLRVLGPATALNLGRDRVVAEVEVAREGVSRTLS